MLPIDTAALALFMLVLVRVTALVFFSPIFGPSRAISRVKAGTAFLLAVVLTPALLAGPRPPVGVAPLLVLAAREAALGLLLAMVVTLFLAVARGAGELVSLEMGLGISATADPSGAGNSPAVSVAFETVALLVLFAVDGHHLVLRALKLGFDAYPPGALSVPEGALEFVHKLFLTVCRSSVTLAAPILLVLFTVTVGTALVMRAVPQVHVLDFGFPARVLLAVVLVALFIPLFGPALVRLFERIISGVAALMAPAAGGG